MTVYRIQSKQDRMRGAYSSLAAGEQCLPIVRQMMREHDNNQHDHPVPHHDKGITGRKSFECCGCPSAAALLRWFRGFIPDLLRAGYEIVALRNVTITAVGKYQVLFKWND